jgi:hypothetical protein
MFMNFGTGSCEKALGNGAIVDVHLQKGRETTAVEIAVVSKPEREMSHIRNCLTAGYDKVFCIFADETLLQRTMTAIQASFSQAEQGKIWLLPLRTLSQLG